MIEENWELQQKFKEKKKNTYFYDILYAWPKNA